MHRGCEEGLHYHPCRLQQWSNANRPRPRPRPSLMAKANGQGQGHCPFQGPRPGSGDSSWMGSAGSSSWRATPRLCLGARGIPTTSLLRSPSSPMAKANDQGHCSMAIQPRHLAGSAGNSAQTGNSAMPLEPEVLAIQPCHLSQTGNSAMPLEPEMLAIQPRQSAIDAVLASSVLILII